MQKKKRVKKDKSKRHSHWFPASFLDLVHLGTSSERAHSLDLSSWPRWTCVMKSLPAYVESFYILYPVWPCPKPTRRISRINPRLLFRTYTCTHARAWSYLDPLFLNYNVYALHMLDHIHNSTCTYIQFTIRTVHY